jgi:16S rRNA (cytosine967-C5)-methyltransferase
VPEGVRLEVHRVKRTGPLPFEPGSFDAVLVDAPCTNTGVLRRRVEARWRLAPQDVAALATVQRDLLERALPLLAPGGRLLYTTCSLEPEENADVVAAFVAAHPTLEVVRTLEVPPGRDADGASAALLRLR